MEAFDTIVSRKEAIRFNRKFFIIDLHYERGTQVDDISISNVGKLRVGKTFRILRPQVIKFCFPEKIDQMAQWRARRYPVIVILEMIGMKKFNVLHASIKL
jgi:hypothetical protein